MTEHELENKIMHENKGKIINKSDNIYGLEQFADDCREMGIDLSQKQLLQFEKYYELLIKWNSLMNLTAITEHEEVLKKHFLDSLSIVKTVDMTKIHTLMDVGTGAGFPGIPLKISYPHLKVVLLDSLGKRVKFLNHVTEELGLEDISAIHGRAEDFARQEKYRESFDLCVSRAVANLSSLSEYCIPYTKKNNLFISYKSGKVEEELDAARRAVSLLGGKVEKVCRFMLTDAGERALVVIRKEKSTPKKYPRKAGLPAKEPL
ncbi:16S rRNA methyltransferase GidB [Marvinbryantia formatexigens DSM 14469]|uniref:Ribosomal RNA small subunit methyltransferase G n=2 Tax=Marvinbryantia TaxID=248744 RepID=C6LKJ3_9FIRM|nr:16S rRNA methyltransferase GidB [Marvinbryantia formatexigens DSM 14469]SDG88261.1 16S rRNA m(7)G-527 methyltransferase [Marvinbryantia formatexigens]